MANIPSGKQSVIVLFRVLQFVQREKIITTLFANCYAKTTVSVYVLVLAAVAWTPGPKE
jgi:hypothetical protein